MEKDLPVQTEDVVGGTIGAVGAMLDGKSSQEVLAAAAGGAVAGGLAGLGAGVGSFVGVMAINAGANAAGNFTEQCINKGVDNVKYSEVGIAAGVGLATGALSKGVSKGIENAVEKKITSNIPKNVSNNISKMENMQSRGVKIDGSGQRLSHKAIQNKANYQANKQAETEKALLKELMPVAQTMEPTYPLVSNKLNEKFKQ